MYIITAHYLDGSKAEDKAIFIDGLVLAEEKCRKRLEDNPTIDHIVLTGFKNNEKHKIERKNLTNL